MTKEQVERYPYIAPKIKLLEQERNELYGSYSPYAAVKGSMPEFPYTEHSVQISGYEGIPAAQERLQNIRHEIEQLKTEKAEIEQYVDGIWDIRTQQIVRLRGMRGEKWKEVVAHFGHLETERTVKYKYYSCFTSETSQMSKTG